MTGTKRNRNLHGISPIALNKLCSFLLSKNRISILCNNFPSNENWICEIEVHRLLLYWPMPMPMSMPMPICMGNYSKRIVFSACADVFRIGPSCFVAIKANKHALCLFPNNWESIEMCVYTSSLPILSLLADVLILWFGTKWKSNNTPRSCKSSSPSSSSSSPTPSSPSQSLHLCVIVRVLFFVVRFISFHIVIDCWLSHKVLHWFGHFQIVHNVFCMQIVYGMLKILRPYYFAILISAELCSLKAKLQRNRITRSRRHMHNFAKWK